MQGKIAIEEHFSFADVLGGGDVQFVGQSANWSDVQRRLLDFADLRLAEMDRHGIELAILSFVPGVQEILDPAEAVAAARRANDALADEVAKHPDRLAGFAALPLQDPEAAILELTRSVKELGFKGALVHGYTQRGAGDEALYYDFPEFHPFWAALAELNVPLYLHPRMALPTRAQAYDGHPWIASAAWGFAAETSIHVLRLIGSGLFDEFPGLQIVLGHLGERIPYDMWRLDHRIHKSPRGYPLDKPMSAYLRANFHMTTSGNFSDNALACALAEMGAERLLFSVDYPLEDTDEAAHWFDNTELAEADRRKIGRTNAAALFKLDLA